MINFIIVDDEYLETVLIQKSYKWEENGFFLKGTAESGKEGLELFRENPVDLVLTDINMPFMDGLSFAAEVKKISPETEIIVITGYDEFEYAKKGIEIGVVSYILKPINPTELAEVLGKTKKAILQKKKDFEDSEKNKKIVMESFFQRMLSGRVGKDEFLNISKGKFSFLREGIVCVNIYKEDFICHEDLAEKLALLFFDRDYICFEHFQGSTIVILKADSESDNPGIKKNFLDINDFFGKGLQIGISQVKIGENGIFEAYWQTQSILGTLEMLMDYSVLSYEELSLLNFEKINPFKSKYQELKNAYIQNDSNVALEILERYMEKMQISETRNQTDGKIIVSGVLTIISEIMWELGFGFSDIFKDASIYKRLAATNSYTAARGLLTETIQKGVEYINESSERAYPDVLNRIIEYIDGNFTDSNISLKTVSNKFFINESYLSRIFKLYKKQNFIDYLLTKRMELAKALILETSLKNYEIAERVGINDANYFGQCFKKYTNKTVNNYRKNRK